MMAENITIPAIHDDDLKSILVKHNLYERVMSGMVRCYLSEDIITWENIYALQEISGELKLICDNPECIDKLNNEE